MKHKTKIEFYEKYKRLAEINGVSLKRSSIFPQKDELMELYLQDKHLNNISLYIFDILYSAGRRYHPKTWPVSLAENTCMYKHLLIYEILELEPEFVDSFMPEM